MREEPDGMRSNRFVIPHKGGSILASFEKGHIEEIVTLDVPYDSRSIVTADNFVVSLCHVSEPEYCRLRIFDVDVDPEQPEEKPADAFRAIAAKGTTVYLGGQYSGRRAEGLCMMNVHDWEHTLFPIDIPLELHPGKSIDAILIRGDKMLLVDNVVLPKYLLIYDIRVPNQPKYMFTVELHTSRTYEDIYKGDINDEWIVLLSSSVGEGGTFQHITMLGRRETALFLHTHSMETGQIVSEIKDICLLGNYLVVLREDGLYGVHAGGDRVEKIADNPRKYEKLLRIHGTDCLLVNRDRYELLDFPAWVRNEDKKYLYDGIYSEEGIATQVRWECL